MHRRALPPLVILLVCFAFAPSARAGALEDIEHSGTSQRTSSSDHEGESFAAEEEEHADGGSDDGLSIWAYVFLMPWVVPRALVDDACATRYALHPYADGRGNLRNDGSRAVCSVPMAASQPARSWALSLGFEGAYAWSERVGSGSVDLRLQLPRRVELSGRLALLHEASTRDQALHGTAHLAIRFAQARHVELRTGLGARAYGLHRPLVGADLFYGMDAFGRRPVIGRLELHIGTLGAAGAGQARLTLGAMLGKVELYAGYDHTVIWGDRKTTRLSGPLLGARVWF